jgi:NAD(P)-dependent dehydrogenase (short-subunit alcohol dehydrogenase family)
MNGLVTLITGGAAGLGLACAKRFARHGARVIICDLPSSKGNEVVDQWSSAYVSSANVAIDEPDGKLTVDGFHTILFGCLSYALLILDERTGIET